MSVEAVESAAEFAPSAGRYASATVQDRTHLGRSAVFADSAVAHLYLRYGFLIWSSTISASILITAATLLFVVKYEESLGIVTLGLLAIVLFGFVGSLFSADERIRRTRLWPAIAAIVDDEARLRQRLIALAASRERGRLVPEVYAHMQLILDTLAAFASKHVGADCTATINLLCLSTDKATVRDVAPPEVTRVLCDSKSSDHRLRVDRYSYQQYAALREIVEANKSLSTYACADLLESHRNGTYHNPNDNWRALYNSVVVVPISDFHRRDLSRVYGFVCFDSYAGNVTARAVQTLVQLFTGYLFRSMDLLSLMVDLDVREQEGTLDSTTRELLTARLKGSPQEFSTRGGFATMQPHGLAPVDAAFQSKLDGKYQCLAKLARRNTLPVGSPGASERVGEPTPVLLRASPPEARMTEDDDVEAFQQLLSNMTKNRREHPTVEAQEAFALVPSTLTEQTAREIQEHLKGCVTCQSAHRRLVDNREYYSRA
jgi:hypothetical protein